MRLLLVIAFLNIAMPLTGFGWAEGSNLILDPKFICSKKRLRGKLEEICRQDSDILKVIINGINLGLRECEYQFKDRRWNCTILRRSMRKILMKDTRETSFVSAITSAGITYAVTRACTMGTLIECSCDKNYYRRKKKNRSIAAGTVSNESTSLLTVPPHTERRNSIEDFSIRQINANTNTKPKRKRHHLNQTSNPQPNINSTNFTNRMKRMKFNQMRRERKLLKSLKLPDGDWEWGGCGDNIQFGFRKSKEFFDSRLRKRSDIKTLLKLHNNNAGRLTVRDNMKLECKCHGLSGSCTMKTCWFKMPTFRDIGNILKLKFDSSSKVIAGNDGNSFIPYQINIKPATKYDLVYTDESPDFCTQNWKTGSMGTHGRECNSTSEHIDGCKLLCCGRGYDKQIRIVDFNCQCVFKWCCDVKCQICQMEREVTTCR